MVHIMQLKRRLKKTNPSSGRSAAQIGPNSALQLGGTLAEDLGQVLQVVTGRDPKLPDKVLSSSLEVAVLLAVVVILRAAEVSI
jgi:hypothetical protein